MKPNKNNDIFLFDAEGSWDKPMSVDTLNRFMDYYGYGTMKIKDTSKTYPRIRDTGPTQPKVDVAKVAKALGAQIAFPVVRRVFPGLIANQIVSVQPMSMPAGALFYMDYVYGGKGNKYLKTKLKVSHIYKAVVLRGINVPLYDNHLNKIGEVKPYDLCMYLKTDVIMDRANTKSLKCHKIMVGDQAGWVDVEQVRFKRVTSRMVRRQEIKAQKEEAEAAENEQRRLSEMGELSPDAKHTIE